MKIFLLCHIRAQKLQQTDKISTLIRWVVKLLRQIVMYLTLM